MANPNYNRGVRFEREVMKEWEAKGYAVLRTAGSHGAFDVIAYHPNRPVEFIQCKVLQKGSIKEAHTMTKRFVDTPPLRPSKYFHQVLEVKVTGENARITGTV
jgi:Holliday junction resolvase